MTFAFFSNVLNHHQIAFCDSMYDLCGDRFIFVELSSLKEDRKLMGFKAFERGYKISNGSNTKVLEIARLADVAIMGAESYAILKYRLTHRPRSITFSYSERWLKKGIKNILSPKILRQILLYKLHGYRLQWYMLCASGFLAKDLNKLHLFKNRCYKWGYFPNYVFKTMDDYSPSSTVKILWVARFIDWKHPETMIALARKLSDLAYNFQITMVGDGPERTKIIKRISEESSLNNKVFLPGNLSNEEVIKIMQDSDIFCLTSNCQEGWGAVLGEAMSAGCCPIASSEAGATPFLIKAGENGLTFKPHDTNELFQKVCYLIDNPAIRIQMSQKAQKTIQTHWTASVAARNFLELASAKFHKTPEPVFNNEPCALIQMSKR